MKKKIRNILAAIISKTFIFFRLDKKVLKEILNQEKILSIYFHNPSREEFSDAIKYLKSLGLGFISVDELCQIIKNETTFPKGKVLVTVDDGWESNYHNMVPVAEAEKVPITIFVATEAIEYGNYWFNYAKAAEKMGLRYPSKDSLKDLQNSERLKIVEEIKKGVSLEREAMTISQLQIIDKLPYVTIEAHSHIHPILPNCTDAEVQQDILECKSKLEKWLERPLKAFAYPNGDYGDREVKLLKASEFLVGFSNNPSFIEPTHLNNAYNLPRIGFLEGASKIENQCRMLGLWHKYTFSIFKG
jgi:peptidoglycan/xylan/chitin deacetylase (PgdA/CDA1 family)